MTARIELEDARKRVGNRNAVIVGQTARFGRASTVREDHATGLAGLLLRLLLTGYNVW